MHKWIWEHLHKKFYNIKQMMKLLQTHENVIFNQLTSSIYLSANSMFCIVLDAM